MRLLSMPLGSVLTLSLLVALPARADALATSVDELLEFAEATRVALPPVKDSDEVRGKSVEAKVMRLILEREREEVITPGYIKSVMDARALGDASAFKALSADHVLAVEVVDGAGEVSAQMRLISTTTGEVIGQKSASLGAGQKSSANARTVRGGIGELVDELFAQLTTVPGEHRYQRVAVEVRATDEITKTQRLDRVVATELSRGLASRGFLIVERERLNEVIDQQSLALMLEEQGAEAGKVLDAQAFVSAEIAEAGEVFMVSARSFSAVDGKVIGSVSKGLPRDGVVTLASGAVETRTAGEALFRSAVAPGWGQFYNRQQAKGAAFAGVTYGAALTTVGLGTVSYLSFLAYGDYAPAPGTSPAKASADALALREQTNGLVTATVVAGSITGALWLMQVADAALGGMQ